jgi:hypothetical protein
MFSWVYQYVTPGTLKLHLGSKHDQKAHGGGRGGGAAALTPRPVVTARAGAAKTPGRGPVPNAPDTIWGDTKPMKPSAAHPLVPRSQVVDDDGDTDWYSKDMRAKWGAESERVQRQYANGPTRVYWETDIGHDKGIVGPASIKQVEPGSEAWEVLRRGHNYTWNRWNEGFEEIWDRQGRLYDAQGNRKPGRATRPWAARWTWGDYHFYDRGTYQRTGKIVVDKDSYVEPYL